jgi:hypothetical protein
MRRPRRNQVISTRKMHNFSEAHTTDAVFAQAGPQVTGRMLSTFHPLSLPFTSLSVAGSILPVFADKWSSFL